MSRNLTAAEISLAKSVFKDSINYSLVKIHFGQRVDFQPDNSGMTPEGEIYATTGAYLDDYGIATPESKAFFIHESSHVWQYQNNILHVKTSAILETIKHYGKYDKLYFYTLENGKTLIDYGIEQQAMMIEDYYMVVLRGMDFSR